MAKRSAAEGDKTQDHAGTLKAPLAYWQPVVRRRPKADANMTADYIASMLLELAAMSGEARLDLLTYLIQLARVEAESVSRA